MGITPQVNSLSSFPWRKGLECNLWVWSLSGVKCFTEYTLCMVLVHYRGAFYIQLKKPILRESPTQSPRWYLAALGFKAKVAECTAMLGSLLQCMWNTEASCLVVWASSPLCKLPWTYPLPKYVSYRSRSFSVYLTWHFLSLSLSPYEGGRDGISTSKPQKFWMNISIPISATLTPVRKPKRN